ncbi:MAG TPA: hypothetical protein VD837_11665 [Terriglobales bacterium]|nr:hypothetical protein [Terriglobales bacterium]
MNLFLNAQAEGRWNHVSVLLGDYRRGNIGYKPFTKAHKDCLISQMQAFPMISFDYTVDESSYSSEILFTPASRRWWTLVGEGTFRVGSKIVRSQTWLIAYRDRGKWFFTPSNYDDVASAKANLTEIELSRDRKDEVDLPVAPGCPLEVTDLHVFADRTDLKYRRVHFRLRNTTNNRITRYGFKISDDRQDGSIEFGTGAASDAIEPGGVSRTFDENYSAYLYWCEGEHRIRIEIDHAYFEDGREWNAPEPSRQEKKSK